MTRKSMFVTVLLGGLALARGAWGSHHRALRRESVRGTTPAGVTRSSARPVRYRRSGAAAPLRFVAPVAATAAIGEFA